jgi:predicted negative regulator of RcsB-dependent stress response
MPYDHEEQEQLAELKGWWHDHGNFVLGAVAALALALGGWLGWRAWQDDQSAKAGTLYESLTRAVREGDLKALREAGGTLAENHPKSLYASLGALVSARVHFERGDGKNAKAQLQWVLERSPSAELRDIARLRLAALLLDERAYDEALKLLASKHAEAFAAQYAALKGDLLTAKNQAAEAKAAYRLALEKADRKNDSFRASVQMRLDALGG